MMSGKKWSPLQIFKDVRKRFQSGPSNPDSGEPDSNATADHSDPVVESASNVQSTPSITVAKARLALDVVCPIRAPAYMLIGCLTDTENWTVLRSSGEKVALRGALVENSPDRGPDNSGIYPDTPRTYTQGSILTLRFWMKDFRTDKHVIRGVHITRVQASPLSGSTPNFAPTTGFALNPTYIIGWKNTLSPMYDQRKRIVSEGTIEIREHVDEESCEVKAWANFAGRGARRFKWRWGRKCRQAFRGSVQEGLRNHCQKLYHEIMNPPAQDQDQALTNAADDGALRMEGGTREGQEENSTAAQMLLQPEQGVLNEEDGEVQDSIRDSQEWLPVPGLIVDLGEEALIDDEYLATESRRASEEEWV